ncbi:MAG TPA: hypothetical protein ENK32_03230, partial [Anaerolineae bacterium]|nr:hypothetical protein [Anaerolineae bacterium]
MFSQCGCDSLQKYSGIIQPMQKTCPCTSGQPYRDCCQP